MAPSNMFSYLRPGHTRRNTSSVASPEPVSSPPAHPLPSPSQSTEYLSSPRLLDNASYTSGSPVSPFPPQLPPIPRVASKLEKPTNSLLSPQHAVSHEPSESAGHSQTGYDEGMLSPTQSAQHQMSPSHQVDTRPSSRSSAKGLRPVSRSQGQSLAQVVEQARHAETPSATQSSSHMAPSIMSTNHSNYSKSQTSLIGGLSEKLSNTSKPATPTAQPQKSGKRLNIRNPMSLLMRRRSGQTLDPLADESIVSQRSSSTVPPMPDNYDPSIRGRIVHDFSAPRPNRNFSYNNAYADEQRKVDASPPKIDREHTPVFTEHFDDDTSYEQSQAAIRAEQLANNDFLKRNSYVPPPPGRSPPPPPAIPKDSPPIPTPQPSLPAHPPIEQVQEFGSSILSPVQESSSPTQGSIEVTPRKMKSTKTPPPSRSRATSITDPSFSPTGLPKHLTSRSSRFSFQIGGGDSADQEKILEERHIKKSAEKASKQEARTSTNTFEDDYDEFGMDDDFDMDGGYEEEIPMLGDEDDYAGLGDQTMSPGMAAFDFSGLSLQPNTNSLKPIRMEGEAQTPREANGIPIGFAISEDTMQNTRLASQQQLSEHAAHANELNGLGLMNLHQEPTDLSNFTPAESPDKSGPTALNQPDLDDIDLGDDMYFDDGMIDEQGNIDAVEFDENVFDDPNGPLFDRKVKSAPTEELGNAPILNIPEVPRSEIGYEADDDTLTKHFETSEPSLAHTTSRAQPKPEPDLGSLNAYHGALANAANLAEAQGRFTRKLSIDMGQTSSDADDSSTSNSRPSLMPENGRFSQESTGFLPEDDGFGMVEGFVDDYDYSDYDSALEDDPMIAAANAEALSIDYDGFYGQEFGFYASAQGEAINSYGGFFGSSGLGRSVSGRNVVHEPNLTPITERSEYSTRNSFISINHFRDSQQLTSPGLAQLARISPYGWRDDEDMSLDALVKLRKGAFGSTASLPASSSNSPRNSSPMGMQVVPRASSPVGNRMHEQNESSTESEASGAVLDERDEYEEDDEGLADAANAADYEDEQFDQDDSDESPDSPTLIASEYNSLSSPSHHLQMNEMPPVPQMPQHSPPAVPTQHPANVPLTMSPTGFPLHSPSAVPLPTSPPTQAYSPPPPLTLHTSFYAPTSSTVSPPLSSAAATNSTAPRRQSLGLISPVSASSPITPGGGSSGWKAGHSRKGSAADSVAYVREQDECGSERWVLERRRTAESGELELVGRSIVEGGRI